MVLAPLPVAIPMAAAAVLMALAPLLSRYIRDILAIAAAAATTVICIFLVIHSWSQPIVYWFGGWQPRQGIALGISFVVEPIGAGASSLAGFLVTASLVYCWRYFRESGSLFPALMLVFLGAMAGFALTGDLFNLFVLFELMSVAAYALTGFQIEEEEALMGAFNFAVTNSIGAFLILTGIALLYGRTGALNLAQIGQALAGGPADGLVLISMLLITIGFGIKAAMVPFQFWLADAHAVAPTPVCVLFSGIMVELGLYAIARIYWSVYSGVITGHVDNLRMIWVAFGVLTALVGAIMCFAQRHLKRLLAFSTVSHTGIALTGVALLGSTSVAGTTVYVLGHGLVKGSLFLGTGVLLNRFASVDESRLHGRGKIFPLLGVLFLIGGLGLSGLPPFGTYLGKSMIDEAAHHIHYEWVPAVLLVAAALTGGAVLRATAGIFLGWGKVPKSDSKTPKKQEKETEENYNRVPLVMFVPTAVLMLMAFVPGCWPAFRSYSEQAAERFIDRPAYAGAVLYSANAPVPETTSQADVLTGVLYGVGATVLAIVMALLALYQHRIPRRARTAASWLGTPLLRALRALHSGDVADYAIWIVTGLAVMGILFAFLLRS